MGLHFLKFSCGYVWLFWAFDRIGVIRPWKKNLGRVKFKKFTRGGVLTEFWMILRFFLCNISQIFNSKKDQNTYLCVKKPCFVFSLLPSSLHLFAIPTVFICLIAVDITWKCISPWNVHFLLASSLSAEVVFFLILIQLQVNFTCTPHLVSEKDYMEGNKIFF